MFGLSILTQSGKAAAQSDAPGPFGLQDIDPQLAPPLSLMPPSGTPTQGTITLTAE